MTPLGLGPADDLQGELRQVEAVQVLWGDKLAGGDIRGRPQLPFQVLAGIIDQDIMVGDLTIGIGKEALQDRGDPQNFYAEAGFLGRFPG